MDTEAGKDLKDIDSVANLVEWSNAPSVIKLTEEQSSAKSLHSTRMGQVQEHEDAMFLTGKYKPKKANGKSSIQPLLVRKHAEWRYPSISEPFLNNNKLFSFSPRTYEDRDKATQNELIVNYQFNTDLNITAIMDRLTRELVNKGTAVIKTGWEKLTEKRPAVSKEYTLEEVDDSDEAYQQKLENIRITLEESPILAANIPEIDMVGYEESVKAGINIKAIYTDTEIGIGEYTIDKPTVEVCRLDRVVVAPNCEGDIQKADFIIHSFDKTLSQLKREGMYSNLNLLPKLANTAQEDSDDLEAGYESDGTNYAKPRYRVSEYWGTWDIHGDGIQIPILASYIGSVMVRLEEYPTPDNQYPFVFIKYMPNGQDVNSPYGEPDASLITDNQNVVGAVTRGMIDLLAKNAVGQQGSSKNALDDINLNKYRRGEHYEFNPDHPPTEAFHIHTFPDIPPSASYMLDLHNNEADSLTGIKAFSGGLSGDALGSTATGVRSAMDATARRELSILRRVKRGMIEVARQIMMLNHINLPDTTIVRITNAEFVELTRDDLVGNYDIIMDITTPESEKIHEERLAFMVQTLGDSVPAEIKMSMLADIARLQKNPELEQQLRNHKPEPDPIAEALRELELEKVKLELEKTKAEIEKIKAEAKDKLSDVLLNATKADALKAGADKTRLDHIEQESGVVQARAKELENHKTKSSDKSHLAKSGLDSKPNGKGNI